MGCAPGFKAYVAAEFSEAIVHQPDAPDGIVLDFMPILHRFKPSLNGAPNYNPIDDLVNRVWSLIKDARCAAICFDVSSTTPNAKQIEWRDRPKPKEIVTKDNVERWIFFGILPHYDSMVATRSARIVLCQHIVQELYARLPDAEKLKTVFTFGETMPEEVTGTTVIK